MKLSVTYQESYSRSELLLRTIFGPFYIVLPHVFLLLFMGLWGTILSLIAFITILFTGRYPESMFEFQVQLLRWQLRVNARIQHLSDGYPSFGLSGTDEYTSFEVEYPERISRGATLLRIIFGVIYVILPHAFILYFRILWGSILQIYAWFSVLFTSKFPKSAHNFLVGTLRWQYRVNLYMANMTDVYPPFSGDENA
ncbi:DUF4389 domain-containing protein [Flavobacteriaceae bacterium]|nr:DUF4389 domain-containing protein [Flavobacteriaceae bacterium]